MTSDDTIPSDHGNGRLSVEIRLSAVPLPGVGLDRLRQHVTAAATRLDRQVARVDVVVVNDQAMDQLHQRFAGVGGTTDVLTFPGSAGSEPIEVDIVICADEAARRAAEFGHSLEHELLLYVVHGLLHCAGYDDHDSDSFDRMHAEEDRILTDIGVGPLYRPAGDGGLP